MAGATVTIDVKGLHEARAKLGTLGRRLGDLTPVMDDIGRMLVDHTVLRFEREEDPDGHAWTPSLRALLSGGQTLTDQGHLKASITHRPGRDRVEVGSNVIYARIHQLGGQAGRRGSAAIPARPYLGFSADDEADTLDIVNDYLAEALA